MAETETRSLDSRSIARARDLALLVGLLGFGAWCAGFAAVQTLGGDIFNGLALLLVGALGANAVGVATLGWWGLEARKSRLPARPVAGEPGRLVRSRGAWLLALLSLGLIGFAAACGVQAWGAILLAVLASIGSIPVMLLFQARVAAVAKVPRGETFLEPEQVGASSVGSWWSPSLLAVVSAQLMLQVGDFHHRLAEGSFSQSEEPRMLALGVFWVLLIAVFWAVTLFLWRWEVRGLRAVRSRLGRHSLLLVHRGLCRRRVERLRLRDLAGARTGWVDDLPCILLRNGRQVPMPHGPDWGITIEDQGACWNRFGAELAERFDGDAAS